MRGTSAARAPSTTGRDRHQKILPDIPQPALMGVGVTAVIFLILAVHPILLSRTPFGVVPAVLLGMVESLLVMTVMPLLEAGAPRLDLLALVGILGYGCLMTLLLVGVQNTLVGAVLGKDWRAPDEPAPLTPGPGAAKVTQPATD